MKTYKELKTELFEEVAKIDVSKLTLEPYGQNSLMAYTSLLAEMSKLPSYDIDDNLSANFLNSVFANVFNGFNNGFNIDIKKGE